MVAYLQFKHQGVHLHSLDMRDTYTNLIINDNDVVIFKAQNESYQMTYAVKPVIWCGHERYPMMMEINQSLNHTWKVTNVVMYCDTLTYTVQCTHPHADPYIEKKYIYI